MTLSIKDLQSIMAPLTDLGRGEATFEVGGLSITIRTLSPEEEIATQRYARGALTEGDSNDQINALDYLDRFRSACLGYAIMQIGDIDFRNVSTVETGEKLPNGVAVKVKKHEAIMKVMESWSRQMVTTLFQRFTSLMDRVESSIEKTLKYDDDHIDAEIARLEEKLAELKSTKAKREAGKDDPRGLLRDTAANKPKEVQPELKEAKGEAPIGLELPPDIPKAVVAQDEAPAPQPKAEAASAPQQRKPVFGDRPKPREVTPSPAEEADPLRGVMSSLADTDDPDVIEAENRRIMAERLSRKPPHVAAREVAQAVEQAGVIDGVPVFKMPVQDLNPDTAKNPVRTPPTVAKSNINPNFRPAK